MDAMKVVIASTSPVKQEAVKRAFAALFPASMCTFESVKASSKISDQPMSDDETRTGAINRVDHSKELSPQADFYIGLEGGVEKMYGDLYNLGWVVAESHTGKRGYGRTVTFALPPAIKHAIIHEGLEQGPATDKLLQTSLSNQKTGTIGPLTNDSLTYVDWYVPAVISALVPFIREDLYPNAD